MTFEIKFVENEPFLVTKWHLDYPKLESDDKLTPLAVWYEQNSDDVTEFEKYMRRKVHYVIKPEYLWSSISIPVVFQWMKSKTMILI